MAGGGKVKIKGGVASHNEATVVDGALTIAVQGGGGVAGDHNALFNMAAPNDDHTQYYHIDGRRALTGDMDAGNNDLVSIGQVAIGSAVVHATATLDVAGPAGNLAVMLRNDNVNATGQSLRIGIRHFLIAEEPAGLFYCVTSNAANDLFLGGGSGTLNAATAIRFHLAANNVTIVGTEMVRMTSGGVRIEDGVTASASFPLHVIGQTYINQNNAAGAIPCLELDQDDTDQEFIEFDGTSSADAASSLSSLTGGNAIQGWIRVTINTVDRWIPFYDTPTT